MAEDTKVVESSDEIKFSEEELKELQKDKKEIISKEEYKDLVKKKRQLDRKLCNKKHTILKTKAKIMPTSPPIIPPINNNIELSRTKSIPVFKLPVFS